jgi:hypothetical protein
VIASTAGTNRGVFKIYHRQSGRQSTARRLHGLSEKLYSRGPRASDTGITNSGNVARARCGKMAIFETGLMRKVEVHGR